MENHDLISRYQYQYSQ